MFDIEYRALKQYKPLIGLKGMYNFKKHLINKNILPTLSTKYDPYMNYNMNLSLSYIIAKNK